jgi:two-component system copper resistance phosphate regulon response regulator CusR
MTSGSLALALPSSKIRCGELEVDRIEKRAVLAGRVLPLTGREYALLAYMAERANRVVQRSVLLATIWTSTDAQGSNVLNVYDGSNVVNVYVGHLRRKLGTYAAMIETIRGYGYCLRPTTPIRVACDNDTHDEVAPPPSGFRVSA